LLGQHPSASLDLFFLCGVRRHCRTGPSCQYVMHDVPVYTRKCHFDSLTVV
jgi:hypothetical protein